MATESVTTEIRKMDSTGSKHDLWLGDGECMTIRLDRKDKAFPPEPEHVGKLCDVILGLTKATEIIASELEGDEIEDQWRAGLALKGIVDAIALYATIVQGVDAELHRCDSDTGATS